MAGFSSFSVRPHHRLAPVPTAPSSPRTGSVDLSRLDDAREQPTGARLGGASRLEALPSARPSPNRQETSTLRLAHETRPEAPFEGGPQRVETGIVAGRIRGTTLRGPRPMVGLMSPSSAASMSQEARVGHEWPKAAPLGREGPPRPAAPSRSSPSRARIDLAGEGHPLRPRSSSGSGACRGANRLPEPRREGGRRWTRSSSPSPRTPRCRAARRRYTTERPLRRRRTLRGCGRRGRSASYRSPCPPTPRRAAWSEAVGPHPPRAPVLADGSMTITRQEG